MFPRCFVNTFCATTLVFFLRTRLIIFFLLRRRAEEGGHMCKLRKTLFGLFSRRPSGRSRQMKPKLSSDGLCLHGYGPMQYGCGIREGTTNQVLWVAITPQCSTRIKKEDNNRIFSMRAWLLIPVRQDHLTTMARLSFHSPLLSLSF